MLRMYECGWCQTQQVKDDGSVKLVPDGGGRMASHLRGKCYKNCRGYLDKPFTPVMRPMTRDKYGNWKYGSGSKSKNIVEPPIISR